jgi:hypothetical protein
MDKTQLLQFLSTQEATVLLDLLSVAYDEMSRDQQQVVFGRYVRALPPAPVEGEALLTEVEEFRRESLTGVYYAPFDINSKNWMHVPDETEEWFERLGNLLNATTQLTAQGDHRHAVACFSVLYELIGAMERGDEIVFGDEIGSWMIPGDEKQYVAAYMTSLVVTATPEEFTAAALPLIQRDSWQSFASQAYTSAMRVANGAQRTYLEAEIRGRKIKTGREP